MFCYFHFIRLKKIKAEKSHSHLFKVTLSKMLRLKPQFLTLQSSLR
jgi:hypothetical protein